MQSETDRETETEEERLLDREGEGGSGEGKSGDGKREGGRERVIVRARKSLTDGGTDGVTIR